MHSSVGTGSLAYVVGSKVMDMRKSYRDESVKVSTTEEACVDDHDDTENHNHSDWSNNGTDAPPNVHRRGSSSESIELASGRESPESVVYKTSTPFGFASPAGYYDFPSLPVTDLFGRNSLDKIEVSTPESEIRSEEKEGMHHFRVDKNAELVREQHKLASEIEVMHSDSVGPSSYPGSRISDVPETASVKESPSRVGNVTEDRVSEWLWTLHRIGRNDYPCLFFFFSTT